MAKFGTELSNEEINAKKIKEIQENFQEKFDELENRMKLLEIIVTKQTSETQPEPQQEVMKVIQINANDKSYFCTTAQEQQIFDENNPGAKTETFNIELSIPIANERLNNPENKKQFTRRKDK